jgi:hypothetical protein
MLWKRRFRVKKAGTISIIILCTLLFSCVTTDQVVDQVIADQDKEITDEVKEQPQKDEKPKEETVSQAAEDDEAVKKMEDFLENAQENIFQGKISEGIKQLVSVLAEYDGIGRPSSRVKELASRAETELIKLESAIAIEADTPWLDDKTMQITGQTLDLSLQPAVMITYRGETGRTLVANVPVSFEFVSGSGILTGTVNTDEFGMANCTIARMDNSQEENIIRASLVFRIKNKVYRFESVKRDFVYRPPERKAAIMVMERSSLGVGEDPYILDPVFNRLKELEFDFSLYNGVLSPDDFMKVYEGERDTIGKLGLEGDVSYLVVVFNDTYSVRQVEMNGKKYNIFISEARATTRIIRVEDGKIMYQTTVERSKKKNNNGQGGSIEKAVWDVQSKISADMAEALEAGFHEIRKAMMGGGE